MDDTEEDFDTALPPQFSLTVYDEDNGAVDLVVCLPSEVDDGKPASNALLYGLVIMMMNQDGTIERRVEELLKLNKNINQADAVDSIKLLLMESYNDQIL